MESKKIKILTAGIIPGIEGFIYGPVLTPYFEKLDRIFTMLTHNVSVVEVLEDGSEVELDVTNFDKDVTETKPKKSSKKSEKAEKVSISPSEPVEEPKEEKAEEPVESGKDEVVVDELVPTSEDVVEEKPVEVATEESPAEDEESEEESKPKRGRRKK